MFSPPVSSPVQDRPASSEYVNRVKKRIIVEQFKYLLEHYYLHPRCDCHSCKRFGKVYNTLMEPFDTAKFSISIAQKKAQVK